MCKCGLLDIRIASAKVEAREVKVNWTRHKWKSRQGILEKK